MRPYWKNSISIFFLASFLLLRVMSVHELSHVFSDSDAHYCEQCVLIANSHQGTPLDSGTVQTDFSFQNLFDWAPINRFELYSAPYQKTFTSDYFHNKPPPEFLIGMIMGFFANVRLRIALA